MMQFLSNSESAAYVWRNVFLIVLSASLLLKIWLAQRQIGYVSAHRNAVPAAFVNTISLPTHQKAADYTIAQARFTLVTLLYGALLLMVWTVFGGLQALNAMTLDWFNAPISQQLFLLASFIVINTVLELPLDWYRTFTLEAHFGFNNSTSALWWSDLLKNAMLGALIGLPLAALILWLMQQMGDFWWLWAWLVWTGFGLLMMVVYPTWIAPLFNRFQILENPELVQRITALMQRCGFSAKGFYVMDGSRRSAHANAYFSGLGQSKRVVFFDTLLEKLQPGEVDAVLAHELGHFKHKHILKRMLATFALSLAGFALLGWLYRQEWFYTGLGVSNAFDTAHAALALLLYMLIAPLFAVFVSPFMSASSRKDEFQADAFAIKHSDARDLTTALIKLYSDNASTLTPDPLYVRFYYSHPPASQRLARLGCLTAMDATGGSSQYAK